MNTSSLELSKELYELSGWQTFDQWILANDTDSHPETMSEYEGDGSFDETEYERLAPAYDLGFLLRKLAELRPAVRLRQMAGQKWWAYCEWGVNHGTGKEPTKMQVDAIADTPENTLCLMAIRLFKQGEL